MAIRPFKVSSTDTITTSTVSDSALYCRSSSASDTTQTLTIQGVYTGTTTKSEAASLNGKVEQITSETGWDSILSLTLSATCLGTVTVYESATATKASGDIRIDSQPGDTDQISIGLTGAAITYAFKTSVAGSGYEVKIGSTLAETADNLASAINDSSTGTSSPTEGAGNEYNATAANPYYVATVAGGVVTITDLIACLRSLTPYATPDEEGDFSIRLPSGGVDGTALATVTIAATTSYDTITLGSNTDLGTDNLPGSLLPTSDTLSVGSRPVTIWYSAENVGTAIEWKIQVSEDGSTWIDAGDLDAGTENNMPNLDNNSGARMLVDANGVAFNAEKIRCVFTANANTAPTAINVGASW